MANKKWNVDSAKLMIQRNGGIVSGKKIYHPSPGLRVLGAIDYLVNHNHYYRVSSL